jgi:UDP-glucuronate 4-epimerase
MRVLVTGGAGFIGSHLVDSLLADGHAVVAVDNFDPFYARSVKERNIAAHRDHRGYQLIEGDIRDPQLIARLPRDCDVIVHLAAKAGVRPSIDDPVTYQAVNVAGTQNLLEFARQSRTRQFVFASSSSVYGINPRVPWSEADQGLQPISPYASTKVSGELMGYVYSHLYDLRFIALRFFTVYGPRQRPDLAIHKFAGMIQAGIPIPVFGDGSTRRDYTFIDDIVAGIRSAMVLERPFEVINLGNNQTQTLASMIAGLERLIGRPAVVDRRPEQPGDVPQTWADIRKAEELLRYRPQTPFPTGLDRFCEWFLAARARF